MKMKAVIEDGEGYEVVASGSVITFNHKPIKIRIDTDDENEEDLSIIFKFKEDEKIPEPQAVPSVEGNTLTLILLNYNNVLGTGTGEPFQLGYIGNKDVYISFRVYGFDNASEKLLHYTVHATDRIHNEGER